MLHIQVNRIKILAPFTSVFLIFLGFLKLSIYYNYFNIHIASFIEFTEIVTAFLNDAIFMALAFGGALFFGFILTTQSEIKGNNDFHTNYIEEPSLWNRVKYYFRFAGFNILILDVVYLLCYVIMLFLKKSDFFFAGTVCIAINIQTFFLFLLMEYKRQHYLQYEEKLDPSVYNLVLYFIVITCMLVSTTIQEVHFVKHNKKFIHTSFVVNETTVISDSTHYYIGNTKSYLFFYDDSLDATSVYPMSEVTKLSFGKLYQDHNKNTTRQ